MFYNENCVICEVSEYCLSTEQENVMGWRYIRDVSRNRGCSVGLLPTYSCYIELYANVHVSLSQTTCNIDKIWS